MKKPKIDTNSAAIELIREAHRNGTADAWEQKVRANPQAAKEEFLRSYAATLAEASGTHPDAVKEHGDKAAARFKEMLHQPPVEFAREVLGVYVEPPDDVRIKRTTENIVKCEECPFSLVCLAGRIFGKNAPHNILCIKCGQICVAVEVGSVEILSGGVRSTRIKAQSFYCQERVLTHDMEWKWRRMEREHGPTTTLEKPPWYVDPAPSGKWMRLGICASCEEHDHIVRRYRKKEKDRFKWSWVDENDS